MSNLVSLKIPAPANDQKAVEYPFDSTMIDLETLGTVPGCVILSIAAVPFSLAKNTVSQREDCYYEYVDLDTSLDDGYKISGSTLRFWSEQENFKQQLTVPQGMEEWPIQKQLYKLHKWFADRFKSKFTVWSDGASFDIPILEWAFNNEGVSIPWKYDSVRCLRTMKNLCPDIKRYQPPGTKHDALHDAIAQAKQLIEISQHLSKQGITVG